MATAVHDQPEPLTDTTSEDWMTTAAARRRLGVGALAFDRLIRESVAGAPPTLTTRQIPGCRVQVLRRDVDELLRRSIRVGRGILTTET